MTFPLEELMISYVQRQQNFVILYSFLMYILLPVFLELWPR